jgi:hypothetical protein
MTILERCAAINEIALAIARPRMGDTQHLLSPDMIVKDADRALAMEVIRMAVPINLEMHVRRIIDVTWGIALEDGSVPSTDIQNKIIARLNAQVTARAALACRPQPSNEQLAEQFWRAWRKHNELSPPWSTVHPNANAGVMAGIDAVLTSLACRPPGGEE